MASDPDPIFKVAKAHGDRCDWSDKPGMERGTARAALALSKMNWNNDGLYDPLPVTMGSAKTLAQVIRRMPGLGKGTYKFRFFVMLPDNR